MPSPTVNKGRKEKLIEGIITLILLVLSVAFVNKIAGPQVLRLYLKGGVGDCSKIPILCMGIQREINNPQINKEYLRRLLPNKFPPDMQVSLPNGFTVTKELVTKVYYRKKKRAPAESIFYLVYEPPDFFVTLFPQLKKKGIKDDYLFIYRTMEAKLYEVKNLTDTFFVIMKGVFLPDLGEQQNVNMSKFTLEDKKGFINYSFSPKGNFFDCNIFDAQGNYFRIYAKDRKGELDLQKIFTIISTVSKPE